MDPFERACDRWCNQWTVGPRTPVFQAPRVYASMIIPDHGPQRLAAAQAKRERKLARKGGAA